MPRNEIDRLVLDEALEVIRNPRRRAVLDALRQVEEAELSTLAEAVATREYGTTYTTEERKRVYVSLYQVHIPKLDDYAVVVFEDTDSPVRRGARFEEAVDYVDANEDGFRENPGGLIARFMR